jgi:16S rRNA (adenine1518-N6/adenine1519-N6)-dimethyltransferase
VAVEADPILADMLSRAGIPGLTVEQADVLGYDLTKLPLGYAVVANIPYYVTSAIIRLLLESPNPPALAVLLVQKEVAERIIAEPGRMSVLALSVQFYATASISSVVERHKFWPAPQVDSAVLVLRRLEQPPFAADRLFRLIKAGFGEKRKQLKNSLGGGLNLDPGLTLAILSESDIAPTARAQELAMEQWGRLYQACVSRKVL